MCLKSTKSNGSMAGLLVQNDLFANYPATSREGLSIKMGSIDINKATSFDWNITPTAQYLCSRCICLTCDSPAE